ncbi:hypothetical protein AB0M54_34430 [Actinoplanes sp. NPDC051470]|uniref:hypothetical protein n=1 Tax=Actinoplanes sp. NPDC051470 TaxID=3157224 RepID=UPI00341A3619
MTDARSWTDLGNLTPTALQDLLTIGPGGGVGGNCRVSATWPGDAGNCRVSATWPGSAGNCRVSAVPPGSAGNCRVAPIR